MVKAPLSRAHGWFAHVPQPPHPVPVPEPGPEPLPEPPEPGGPPAPWVPGSPGGEPDLGESSAGEEDPGSGIDLVPGLRPSPQTIDAPFQAM